MFRIIVLLLVVVTVGVHGDDHIEPDNEMLDFPTSQTDLINYDIENFLEKFQQVATHATESATKGIIPAEDTENLFNDMSEVLEELTEMLKESSNVYKFIKAHGIDKVIGTNLKIQNTKLRMRLIVLLKTLFDVAPTSTNAVIPYNIIDNLLDIFEQDDNLAIKAHVLDVLNVWLPENPRMQARVMKIKGLEPFYNQVMKLDTNVIKTLLDLFHKILKEHLRERNKKIQRSKADLDTYKLYQKIGLIERMSTPMVCNGLLNIFEIMWNDDDNKAIFNVFELIKNMKPYCVDVFRGRAKATELFDKLLEHVKNEDNLRLLENSFNITDIDLVISEYIRDIKVPIRDEF